VEVVILLTTIVGAVVTVIDCVALVVPQPPVTVYEITAVPPDTPVTTPVFDTVATEVLLLLQVPPLLPPVRVNVTDDPAQTDDAPLIVPEFPALTAITFEALNVPQVLLTV
jgi:hypothetical protein